MIRDPKEPWLVRNIDINQDSYSKCKLRNLETIYFIQFKMINTVDVHRINLFLVVSNDVFQNQKENVVRKEARGALWTLRLSHWLASPMTWCPRLLPHLGPCEVLFWWKYLKKTQLYEERHRGGKGDLL